MYFKLLLPSLAISMTALISAAAESLTPAQMRIQQAESALSDGAPTYQEYNRLAMAHARRAREIADTSHYGKALAALAQSFKLEPGNYEGRRIEAWVLLGQHEFAQAFEKASELNRLAPDDVMVYGLVADAAIELGRYGEAEKAAQWMLDLRPGNVPGLTRGAYLRELFGDLDGAIDFMSQAYHRIPPAETEDRAWTLTHIAHLQMSDSNLAAAEKTLEQSLALFPDYHYALAQLGKLRMKQERPGDAVNAFRRRYEIAPHPENLYDVARALEQDGREAEAGEAFGGFEKLARAEMKGADNCNRELTFYYLGRGGNPAEGLRIIREEMKRRQDVFTRHAHAWALFRNGEYHPANEEISEALAVGIRDEEMLAHAAVIREKADKPREVASTK
jgi:tetratricopeptide (TPR) repeat protein